MVSCVCGFVSLVKVKMKSADFDGIDDYVSSPWQCVVMHVVTVGRRNRRVLQMAAVVFYPFVFNRATV